MDWRGKKRKYESSRGLSSMSRSFRRYRGEVGRAKVLPQLPDAAVALEHGLGTGLRVDRRSFGGELVSHPTAGL